MSGIVRKRARNGCYGALRRRIGADGATGRVAAKGRMPEVNDDGARKRRHPP
jgi:hypothetical protein